MKILIVHNEYARHGGEETAVKNEIAAMESRGHEVLTYIISNQSISGAFKTLRSAFTNIFNFTVKREIQAMLRQSSPDIVHVHNFFPQISPAVFYACHEEGVACIHTLHNYRIICPSIILFHRSEIYWLGVKKRYLQVIWDAVYRESRLATAAVVLSILIHRTLGSWRKVDLFIALSDFQKNIFEGVIDTRIEVLPHFSCLASLPQKTKPRDSDYHVFAGRLDSEKGILELLEHWPESKKLIILGDGPLAPQVQEKCRQRENIHCLGHVNREQLLETMRTAISVVVPSIWHETFGLVIVESLSVGTPVMVNCVEPFRRLITPGETGVEFDLRSKTSLRQAILEIENLPNHTQQKCLDQFDEFYSQEVGAKRLEQLMETVIRKKHNTTAN